MREVLDSEEVGDFSIEKLNEQDKEGNTLLHKAIEGRKVELVKKLVEKGVNQSIMNKAGENTYILTAKVGCEEIFDVLDEEKYSYEVMKIAEMYGNIKTSEKAMGVKESKEND